MTVLGIGISYGVATLFAMFTGMPIAFALGAVAVVFMAIYMPHASLDTVTQNVYEEMASMRYLSIPLFILKGVAIGQSRAGQDLYSALHAWLAGTQQAWRRQRICLSALQPCAAPRLRPARRSARPASPKCASAATPAGWLPDHRRSTLGILLPPSITMVSARLPRKCLGRLFLRRHRTRCSNTWLPVYACFSLSREETLRPPRASPKDRGGIRDTCTATNHHG